MLNGGDEGEEGRKKREKIRGKGDENIEKKKEKIGKMK